MQSVTQMINHTISHTYDESSNQSHKRSIMQQAKEHTIREMIKHAINARNQSDMTNHAMSKVAYNHAMSIQS